RQALPATGLDSLQTMELKHRLESDLGIDIPLADVLQRSSLTDLAAWLAEAVTAGTASPGGADPDSQGTIAGGDFAATDVAQLSDDEVEAMLAAMMAKEPDPS
ncbi:MAG: acyl carrier protein, partial [Candidatus Sericytochromatia bacterium]|nr:acyl carrier protein [Candidatus Sericytochromatia bacterium]